jgi:drug/metabolite transporter (DMT)-like permease
MALVTLRWLGVMLLLLTFAHQQVRRDWPVLRSRLRFIIAMGALGFTAFNALFYVAAHSTTAVNIGIIQGSIPVFVLLGAFAFYRTPIRGLQVAGVLVTLLGVALVAGQGNLARLASLTINPGDMLMMAACACYAGYTVGLSRRPAVSSLSLFALMAAVAFISSLPLVLVETALAQVQWPGTFGWIIIALIVVFPSFLAQIFFMQGVALIGPGRAGIFVNLVPVFASILAVSFLKEPFELFHGIALALVLGGIWLSERGKPR